MMESANISDMTTSVADLIMRQISDLKDDLREDIRDVKDELKEDFKEIKVEISGKDGICERLTALETIVGELNDREPTSGASSNSKSKKTLKDHVPMAGGVAGGGVAIGYILDHIMTFLKSTGK